ncbi:MAG: RluA family pseudouridine synthase [Eubacteriales bacterium]|nr:RluA family pseudouridine synthase [Eubacteriales bacterium]
MEQTLTFRADAAAAGARLDSWLAAQCGQVTRSRVKTLCAQGNLTVNGREAKVSYLLREGDEVALTLPEPKLVRAQPEEIPLNVVYEDADIIVINKPRGLVVHPAAGNETGTLVNALLARCTDLSGINGEIKPGIVHRIDKDTTGLLVVAKNDAAHLSLAGQIKEKTAGRVYLALVQGNLTQDEGRVDQPIGRDPKERKRMAIVEGGRNAATRYRVLERFGEYTLVECRLETGRTHQIRVHMKYLGHPVVGDPVYGYKKQKFNLEGQLLHAAALELVHPVTGEHMCFHAPLSADFQAVLTALRARRGNQDSQPEEE